VRLATSLLYALTAALLVSPADVRAQFTTVINVPPEVAPTSIGSDTQLNLGDGGEIGSNFDAGADDGSSTNVEVNIDGGSVGNSFSAYGGIPESAQN
jgi:hypothetical protein